MEPDTTTPGGDSPEITALLHSARDVDNAATAVLEGPKQDSQATEVLDPADAWADIPRQVGSILGIVAPELKQVYTEKACKQWGKDMHRVAVKRGWTTDGLPPEVAVAISTASMAVPTFFVMRSKIAAIKAARAAREGGPSAAPGPDAPST